MAAPESLTRQAGAGQGRNLIVPALAVLVLFLGVALVLVAYLLTGGERTDSAAAAGRTASSAGPLPPSSSPSPSPSPTGTSPPVAQEELPPVAPPQRLTIEAAGVDVEILPLTPTNEDMQSQSLVPPYTEDGYWLTTYGSPGQGSQNTTYITGHSWQGREAPFDRLSTHTEVGDAVTLTTASGTLEYEVESITTYNKDTLKDSEVWNVVPNRLVLISCYTEDPWGKNVVVTASPTDSARTAGT